MPKSENARRAMTIGLVLIVLLSAINIAGSVFDEKPLVVCYYDFETLGKNVDIAAIGDCEKYVPLPKPNAPRWCSFLALPQCFEFGKLVAGPYPKYGY